MGKIKRKIKSLFCSFPKLTFLFILLLVYSRLINLSWGLPFPFHPDERNMAVALKQLSCHSFSIKNFQSSIKNCLNPKFFAYGQFPLYLGYFLIQVYFIIVGRLGSKITFEQAVYSLRLISAVAGLLTAVYGLKIIIWMVKEKMKRSMKVGFYLPLALVVFTFSPGLIQFSHFGTTESLLMLFYVLIIYFSLKVVDQYKKRDLIILSLISGLAIATKISAAVYLFIPFAAIVFQNKKDLKGGFWKIFHFIGLTILAAVFFSPHNLINLDQFLGALRYESDVALGRIVPFYTRQFVGTIPFIFQFTSIFPFALGWTTVILFVFGFFFLPLTKEINLLRLAFLAVFLPNGLLFAKWTRFMAPVFPVMILFSILFLFNLISFLKRKNRFFKFNDRLIDFGLLVLILLMILPGIAYLSVYKQTDVRFIASKWIYRNIPQGSYILSETANVVDLPVFSPREKSNLSKELVLNYVSFNFYDLDASSEVKEELFNHLSRADYIFVPSRRIFFNHTCLKREKREILYRFSQKRCRRLKKKYPLLNWYYENLFQGKLGFRKVAEFTSFPRIELFGKTLIKFSDEAAEETWSVFDHPVIRIYKRKV